MEDSTVLATAIGYDSQVIFLGVCCTILVGLGQVLPLDLHGLAPEDPHREHLEEWVLTSLQASQKGVANGGHASQCPQWAAGLNNRCNDRGSLGRLWGLCPRV